jgi:DNA replication ATP-dependent helicase Dna2
MTPLRVLTGMVEHTTSDTLTIRTADGSSTTRFGPDWHESIRSLRTGDEVVVHDGDDPILVTHPKALIDVTELTECMGTSTDVPEVAVLRRFIPSALNVKATEGAIANAAFDMLVRDPSVSDDEVLHRASRSRALSMALAGVHSSAPKEIETNVRALIPVFRETIATWHDQEIDLEASIVAPMLGLQGRLDIAVRQSDVQAQVDVIELKSGSAPGRGIRPAHQAQVAAYGAMLRTIRPNMHGTMSVWYPRATQDQMRAVNDTDGTWLRRLMHVRNAVLDMERGLAERNFAVLKRLTPERLSPAGTFLRDDAQRFLRAYTGMSSHERMMSQAWITSIANEQLAQRERAEHSRLMLEDLRITTATPVLDGTLVTMERTTIGVTHGFRSGDHIVMTSISGGTTAELPAVFKGAIRDVRPTEIDLHLRTSLQALQRSAPDTRWTMVADTNDAGLRRQYATVLSAAEAPSHHRAVLLGESAPGVGDLQDVITAAATTPDVFLVHGPPGTGKTSVLLHGIVERLMQNEHERVLLIAFTNRATDEIERAVLRACPPEQVLSLRSGATDHVTSERLKHARCVVSTIAFMQRSLEVLSLGFTTVIVDEASQALDAHVLGILSRVPRCILIGDHLQLPPVVTQSEERMTISNDTLIQLGMTRTATTTFERLMSVFERNGWTHAIGRLTVQGRMHHAIQEFVNATAYEGRLRPLSPWQTSDDVWLHTDDPQLQAIVRHRLCFIPVPASPTSAMTEARIVAHITTQLLREIDRQGASFSVGVITPFRAQITAIRDLLPPDIRDRISVDTVERYQGSERDVIIFSPAVVDAEGLRTITSLSTTYSTSTDRKLNVAVTRARQQFIMVGRADILSETYSYGILLEFSSFTETSIVS